MAATEPVDISPKSDKGVLKQIIRKGRGPETPPIGARVRVHYVGTLTDGTKFDSSRDRGDPFVFNLGKGNVIKGWDIGVATMTLGERAVLTCASEYAYGKQGSYPTIPPDATLKFEVELLDWVGEDISPKKDLSIQRFQITAGEGYSTPDEGALVEVHLVGKYDGKIFDERDVTFNLGEGADADICEGVEKALKKFKRGEKSRVLIDSKYAFGASGKPEWDIHPLATVEYTITLKSFEKAKESWLMDSKERLEQARLFKEKGTNHFKADKLMYAIRMYNKSTSFLESEDGEEAKLIKLQVHLNLSLCHLKLEQYYEAREAAGRAIELDPQNVKAFFRRGRANLMVGQAKPAYDDFKKVLELEPNNKAAAEQLTACQKLSKQQLEREKKIYANMFDRFARVDIQKEEKERQQQPDVMKSLGEWGAEERERAPTDFEKENPNILMLNGNGEFKDM